MSNSSDEIDLVLLFNKAIDLIICQFRSIILTIIIGILFGLGVFFLQKPTYKSTFVGNTDAIRNEYVSLLAKNLNDLLAEGNSETVAQYLKISTALAKKIIKIEASQVNLKEIKEASSSQNLVNTFQIDVLTSDPEILDSVQLGLIYYIQNNDFVKQRMILQKKYYENMIIKIDFEITKLDSLRNQLNVKNTKAMELSMLDPASINNSILQFYDKRLGYANQLATLNQVLVIQNFVKYKKPVSPKLILNVSAGVSFVLVFGLIWILFSEARRKYLQRKEK